MRKWFFLSFLALVIRLGLSKTERILLIFKLGPVLCSFLDFVLSRTSETMDNAKLINYIAIKYYGINPKF